MAFDFFRNRVQRYKKYLKLPNFFYFFMQKKILFPSHYSKNHRSIYIYTSVIYFFVEKNIFLPCLKQTIHERYTNDARTITMRSQCGHLLVSLLSKYTQIFLQKSAKKMIETCPNLSLKHIAFQLGFTEPTSFYRYF